jgi:glycosyltransferase involved in cell wall biosynthesis
VTGASWQAPNAGRRYYVSVAYSHEPTDPRVRRHCEALARNGWRVVQVGIGAPGERPVGRLNGVVLVRWPRRRYRGSGLLLYGWAYAQFFFWTRRVLARISRRRPVRVVQVNNVPTYLVWAVGPAQRRGATVILDIHDPEPELFLSKFAQRPFSRFVAACLALGERRATRRAQVVFCVHEEHRRLTESHGVAPDKLRVVINHADGALFPMTPPHGAGPFVGYHGTVSRRMGLDVVLKGLRVLKDRGVELHGAFWGDGDDVARLQGIRDGLGLRHVVEIPGQRFRLEELLPRVRKLGIGIVTLVRDVLTDVMLPTKLLEYVRLGVPVVVSWTPTIAHYFPEDSVRYLRELSPGAVADAVAELLGDPAAGQRRAVRAQALPIARAWQESGEEEFVKLVEQLRGGSGGPN